MRRIALSLVLVAGLAAPVSAGDAVIILQENRTAEMAKRPRDHRKQTTIRHVALLQNVSSLSIRGLRVTVELYDYFGKLLWAKTAAARPASLRPGETATLSLETPNLESYRSTRYRFDYREDKTPR
ncbi:MAG TPA: hypothetical protein VMS64_12710 [Candidatus Methylomirabilis sp.]|nr:hypothetical protein [Candidatus Methylomirabilis sp.]